MTSTMSWLNLSFMITNSALLVVALVVNGVIMFFMLKYKRLRAMSVAYLVCGRDKGAYM